MKTHEYEKLEKGKPDLTESCVCGRPYDDSCHSKAPEKISAINNSLGAPIHVPNVYIEAPTDESWNWDFNSLWYREFKNNYLNSLKQFREFIASLIQKEREKGRQEVFDLASKEAGAYEAGKSEAFSLVRKMATEMKIHGSANEKLKQGWEAYNEALTDLLSALEGK